MLLQQFAHAQERKGYTLKMILPLKLIHRWVRAEITMRTLIEKNVREVSDIMGCPVIETILYAKCRLDLACIVGMKFKDLWWKWRTTAAW